MRPGERGPPIRQHRRQRPSRGTRRCLHRARLPEPDFLSLSSGPSFTSSVPSPWAPRAHRDPAEMHQGRKKDRLPGQTPGPEASHARTPPPPPRRSRPADPSSRPGSHRDGGRSVGAACPQGPCCGVPRSLKESGQQPFLWPRPAPRGEILAAAPPGAGKPRSGGTLELSRGSSVLDTKNETPTGRPAGHIPDGSWHGRCLSACGLSMPGVDGQHGLVPQRRARPGSGYPAFLWAQGRRWPGWEAVPGGWERTRPPW